MRIFVTIAFALLGTVSSAAAQFPVPPIEPRAFCFPLAQVAENPMQIGALERPELGPHITGYRTWLRIFKQDQPVCIFPGDEVIWFLIQIENTTNESRILNIFSTTLHADLYVLRPGTSEEVFRWSRHQITDDFPDTLFFDPHEVKSFYTWWFRDDDDGNPVPPGRYDIVGIVVGTGLHLDAPAHPLRSTRQEILLLD